jgi:hypothetical protein
MKRSDPAASPDAYVAGLTGWRRACVEELRAAVNAQLDWRNSSSGGTWCTSQTGPCAADPRRA